MYIQRFEAFTASWPVSIDATSQPTLFLQISRRYLFNLQYYNSTDVCVERD